MIYYKKMCGLIGLFLKDNEYNCINVIIEGLQKLESRGYDACGLVTLSENQFNLLKYANTSNKSGIDLLKEGVDDIFGKNMSFKNAMGHTRWATHGKNTNCNAQPHISSKNDICIIHNGIITNYEELCKKIPPPKQFKSETDSEVISHLIEHYIQEGYSLEKSVKKTISDLRGDFAIIVMSRYSEDTMYCVTNGPPLLIGWSSSGAVIVSDKYSFPKNVEKYVILKENDLIKLQRANNQIYLFSNERYDSANIPISHSCEALGKYPHWTIKEIHEQSECADKLIRRTINDIDFLSNILPSTEIIENIRHLVFLGCGTSYNACCFSRYIFKNLCHFETVQVFDGSDFDRNDIPCRESTLLVFVSQSGETKDLYSCLKSNKDLITIAVVNQTDSVLARNSDYVFDILAGRENAVASTKSFTNQIISLAIMCSHFSLKSSREKEKLMLLEDIKRLPENIRSLTVENSLIKESIYNYFDRPSLFIIGREKCQYIAHEGALKIKEITYNHAEALHSSALKHGPFAVLDKNTTVVLISDSSQENFEINKSTYQEIISRGSPVLWISDKSIDSEHEIIVPRNVSFQSFLCIVPIQIASYFISIKKGINCDKPRNIAKVCTVD